MSAWLDVRTRFGELVLEENLYSHAFNELQFSDVQEPQIIAFVGGKTKSQSLRCIFSIDSYYGHRKVHLKAISSYTDTQSPLFVADCELHGGSYFKESLASGIGSIKQHQITWHHSVSKALDPVSLSHHVYTQLILPFSTIVCLFADDFGGTSHIAQLLSSWLICLSNRSLDIPISTYPRILILQRWSDPANTFDEKLATISFMQRLRKVINSRNPSWAQRGESRLTDESFNKILAQHLSYIRILPLPDSENDRGHVKQFRKLKTRIIQESQDVQKARRTQNFAFSTLHFRSIFTSACRHFASSIVTPFSFYAASREPNPVPKEFASHLINFQRLAKPDILMTFTIPIMASALCLDSYPPGMHIFNPDCVFEKSYSDVLKSIKEEGYSQDHELYVQVENKLKSMFCQQVMRNNELCHDAASSHRILLQSFSLVWKQIYSNSTCLACLARRPEQTLSCLHSFCDTCIIIYGKEVTQSRWRYMLDACPLCQEGNKIELPLKPHTAGVRGLLLDGDGVRALEGLRSLEKYLNLPISMQDYFDIINGSGEGGLLVLQAFSTANCSVEAAEKRFRFTTNKPLEEIGQDSRFSQSIASSSENGRSRAAPVISKLRGVGEAIKTPLLSIPQWKDSLLIAHKIKVSLTDDFGLTKTLFECSADGKKIAVTAIRQKDLLPCIFTNYNGSSTRPSNYELIRPCYIKNEILVWNIGRAVALQKVSGSYHYSDLSGYDELTDITFSEQDNIWNRKGKTPDVFLCLGRLIPTYDQARRMVPEWLSDHRPLQDQKQRIARSADMLLASLFYVELACVPVLTDTGFLCRAHIHCRLTPPQNGYSKLIELLQHSRARFYYDYQSIPCVSSQFLEENRNTSFSRYIEFTVSSLSESIDIKIDGLTNDGINISNCPYIIQDLIEDQGLHCVFGHKDHRQRHFKDS